MEGDYLVTRQAELDDMASHHSDLGAGLYCCTSCRALTSSSSVLVMSMVSTMWLNLVWATLSMWSGNTVSQYLHGWV